MIEKCVSAFAPVNIALVKYWGKRDEILNLPITSSLSVSLNNYGATTSVKLIVAENDRVLLDNKIVDSSDTFYTRLVKFLHLFRSLYALPAVRFEVSTTSNLPIAAGLASSASGFAAISLALNKLFDLKLSNQELSILARRGSGSAARSIYNGFVLWQAGEKADGSDCFAFALAPKMPQLRVSLLIFNSEKKSISSTQAMRDTVQTCPFYKLWPEVVASALEQMQHAIMMNDFKMLGEIAETNALYMHSLMQGTLPPTIYATADTLACIKKIWQLRKEGLQIYFTQDAGPNLKLLHLAQDSSIVQQHFAAYQPIEIAVFGEQ
jgi:diphosphomevalonate decarboxylase